MHRFREIGKFSTSLLCLVFTVLGWLTLHPDLSNKNSYELYSELTDLGAPSEKGTPDSKSSEESSEKLKEVDLYLYHSRYCTSTLINGNKKFCVDYFSMIESIVRDISTPPPKTS